MRNGVESIEILFLVEIILNFVTAYRDRDTFEPEYRLKNIAINYIRYGPFISHALTAFPYQVITHMNDVNDPEE